MASKLHKIEILETVRETGAAVLVHVMACLKIGGGMTGFNIWLPKSQLKLINGEYFVPAWLATKKEHEMNAIWSVEA